MSEPNIENQEQNGEGNAKTSHYHAFELTKEGMELRQAAIAGGKAGEAYCIHFTCGAIGTGRPAPDTDLFYVTTLAEHALDVPIKESYAESINHIMTVVIDNTDIQEDILMTEIGIYARLLDNAGREIMPEILYGYTYTDKYDYIPVAHNYFMHREISFNTVLSRNGNFTIVFDGSRIYASAEDLRNALSLIEERLHELERLIQNKIDSLQGATHEKDGIMTMADKIKLDGIEENANKIILNDTVTSTSVTEAATANAVRRAYEKGVEALNKANEASSGIANAGGVIVQATAPAGNSAKLWVNPSNNIAYYWNGSQWLPVAGTLS